MTLVSSGTLYLAGAGQAQNQSIQYELEAATNGIGLLEAGVLASFTGDIAMSDFYGYSAGSNVVVDFSNSITWAEDFDYAKDGYQSLVLTGRQSGDVITLNVNVDFILDTGSIRCRVWYSINSTTVWTQLFNETTTTNTDVNIPGVDDNDVVRIRVNIFTQSPTSSGDVAVTLTGGTFTSGSGTVTASGSVDWYLGVFEI